MKIRIKFSKQGATKYIGHLDLMRYFQKAMRRADIAAAVSGRGFSVSILNTARASAPTRSCPLRLPWDWDLPEAANIWILK